MKITPCLGIGEWVSGSSRRQGTGRRRPRPRGVEKTIVYRICLDEAFDVGEDTGTAVFEDCQVQFRLNGDIEKLTVLDAA
jgi:hypothetical protein